MSLNKLTTSTDYLQKQFLNIGCNDIQCSTLSVGGTPITPSTHPVEGKYNAPIAISVAGSDDLDGWVYYEEIGNQLKLSLSRLFILGANSAAFTLTMDLPTGYTSTAPSTVMSSVGYATDGTHIAAILQGSTDATGTKLVITTSAGQPLSAGTCYFNGGFVVEI
jgi:hypothetical protein